MFFKTLQFVLAVRWVFVAVNQQLTSVNFLTTLEDDGEK